MISLYCVLTQCHYMCHYTECTQYHYKVCTCILQYHYMYSVHNVPLNGVHIVIFQCKQHYCTLLHCFTMQCYHIQSTQCTHCHYMVYMVLLYGEHNATDNYGEHSLLYGEHSVTQCHYSDTVYTL